MKTGQTLQLERLIYSETSKMGTFGCFEVTIGWFGKERVDYITYDTKGVWRCYEIKVSKSDFNSKAANSFLGHFNYYVMPKKLYDQVKECIPQNIGVYIRDGNKEYLSLAKRPKRCELQEDEKVLKDSLIRSLARDAGKLLKNKNPKVIESYKKQISDLQEEKNHYHDKYWNLLREIRDLYGPRWNKGGSGVNG